MASLEEKVALLKTQAEQKRVQEEQEEQDRLLALEKKRIADEKAAQLELENQQKEKAALEEQERKEQEKTKNLETLASLETQNADMEQTIQTLTIKGAEFSILKYLHSNTELFEPLGITDLKSFVEHPQFQDVEEVDRYQQLLAATPELSLDTEMLLQKINSKYGHYEVLDEDVISSVKKTIENLKPSVEKQILKTKLEIPEKRQEVIEEEATKLEEALPVMKVPTLDKMEFGTRNNPDSYIEQKGTDTKFNRWWEAELIPKEFSELKATYGPEAAQEILAAAHKQKVHSAIEEYDSRNGNYSGFEKVLAENNAEALLEAKEVFRVFNDTVYEAQNVLKQKSEELLSKGISFDPRFIPLYGGTYEEYVFPLESKSSYESIQSSLYDKNRDHPFPPKYPYKDVQKLIQERITDIQEFIEVITSIQNQQDIDNFGESVRNGAPKEKTAQYFHKKQMNARLDKKPPFNDFTSITDKMASLYDAERLVNNQKEIYSKKEEVFSGAIEKAIEAKIMLKELQKEVRDITGSDASPAEWKRTLERTAESAENAKRDLRVLDIFQSSFQGTEYRLDRGFVTDVSIENEIKVKKEELEKIKKEKEDVDQKIENYPKKPKWYELISQEDHDKEIQPSKLKKAELIIKIEEKENEITQLYKNVSIFVLQDSPFKDAFRDLSSPKGSIAEVVAPVRTFLEEKANKVVPPELLQRVEKYHKLVKELE